MRKTSLESDSFSVMTITNEGAIMPITEVISKEKPLTILLNGHELVTLLCSPAKLDYLAVGFLFSEGIIKNRDDIRSIILDDRIGIVRIYTKASYEFNGEILTKRFITSGCGKAISFYDSAQVEASMISSNLQMTPDSIFKLMILFQKASAEYKLTHGVHSCALCDSERLLVFAEDIGRHNAVDKVFGECLMRAIDTSDKLLMVSGRISSEILFKVAKRNIPVLATISVPTDLGVMIANRLGITLVGSVRREKMKVYTHTERIIFRNYTQKD